ncbi:MAG TPA: NAD(P)/FAD-dependent oxidoreductase [Chloroflexota bacterium]
MNKASFGGAPDRRVLIIGGGFGAVYTALGLEKALRPSDRTEVTLINPENFFLFTPLLSEIVSSQIDTSHAINPFRRMFKRTRFVEGLAIHIDLDARSVMVRHPNGEELAYPYDHLVLAVGAQTGYFGMKEVQENSYTAKTLGDAILLRNRAIALLEVAVIERDPAIRAETLTLVVAGGGFTGVEIAAEINDLVRTAAKSYPSISQREIRVILVEAKDRLLPEFDAGLAEFATRRLRAAGVEVRERTTVSGATPREVRIKDGEPIPARTLIWNTGVAPNPLITESALPKSGRGWIKVDATMRVEGLSDVWALGDCAEIPDVLRPGHNQPALAQHAIREGTQLAHNIVADLHGEPARPFRYKTLGQLATLGHFNGIGTVGPIRLQGFPAWFAWRSYYLIRLPRVEKRLRVAADWSVDLIFGRDISQIQTYASTRPGNREDDFGAYTRTGSGAEPEPAGAGRSDGRASSDTTASTATPRASKRSPRR